MEVSIQNRQHKLFSFLDSSPQRKFNIQKKCFPNQTYGVSKEAPKQFKQKYTLLDDRGYIYQHQNKFSTGTDQFHNFTQKNFFTIDHHKPQNYTQQYRKHQIKQKAFNRKKGLLSQYLDKNGWMTKVHKLMGNQRSQQSRNIANNQRNNYIKNLRKPPNSINFQMGSTLYKPVDKSYFEQIPKTMGQKMRIRMKRNSFNIELQKKQTQSKLKLEKAFLNIDQFEKKELNNELQTLSKTARSRFFSRQTQLRNTIDLKSGYASTRATSMMNKYKKQLEDEVQQVQNDDNNSEIKKQRFWETEKIIKQCKRVNQLKN